MTDKSYNTVTHYNIEITKSQGAGGGEKVDNGGFCAKSRLFWHFFDRNSSEYEKSAAAQ
jgi:hypothetical protein